MSDYNPSVLRKNVFIKSLTFIYGKGESNGKQSSNLYQHAHNWSNVTTNWKKGMKFLFSFFVSSSESMNMTFRFHINISSVSLIFTYLFSLFPLDFFARKSNIPMNWTIEFQWQNWKRFIKMSNCTVSVRYGVVNPFKKREFVCHSIEKKEID